MDPVAAKYVGAGLAAIGMGAAAIGVGTIFGNFLSGALRNPSAADGQFGRAFIGAALAEGLGIFAFLVAIILLFVKLFKSRAGGFAPARVSSRKFRIDPWLTTLKGTRPEPRFLAAPLTKAAFSRPSTRIISRRSSSG
jgi:F-type H+-transporting ATPase subunit c